jgi:glucosylceramidase
MEVQSSGEEDPEHVKFEYVQSMLGSAAPNGLNSSDAIMRAWALYISHFISAYEDQGVNLWAVTPQNEPEFAAPWEACKYTPNMEMHFINDYLGPQLADTHPEVLIFAFDHNKDDLVMWTKAALGYTDGINTHDDHIQKTTTDDDPAGGGISLRSIVAADTGGASNNHVSRQLQSAHNKSSYVDGMAFHWYQGSSDRELDGTYGYNSVRESHSLAPDMIMLATEGCSCPGVAVSTG